MLWLRKIPCAYGINPRWCCYQYLLCFFQNLSPSSPMRGRFVIFLLEMFFRRLSYCTPWNCQQEAMEGWILFRSVDRIFYNFKVTYFRCISFKTDKGYAATILHYFLFRVPGTERWFLCWGSIIPPHESRWWFKAMRPPHDLSFFQDLAIYWYIWDRFVEMLGIIRSTIWKHRAWCMMPRWRFYAMLPERLHIILNLHKGIEISHTNRHGPCRRKRILGESWSMKRTLFKSFLDCALTNIVLVAPNLAQSSFLAIRSIRFF